jgi:hypothetical protein
MTERLALTALLSQLITVINAEFERADAGSNSMPSLAVWSNVLQHLDEEGTDLRALKTRSCLSTRALRVALGRLEKRGLLVVDQRAPREKIVRPTRQGIKARDSFKTLIDSMEERWRPHTQLRRSLEQLVEQLELDHPHYPSQYGTADPRVTGGPGQDWSAVPRGDRDRVSELPLSALASQAHMAFTIEYEQRNGPLGWSANVLRFIGKGLPVDELPPTSVSLGGMKRHRAIKITESAQAGKRIVMTALGKRIQERSEDVLQTIEGTWRDRFGAESVDTLRASLEALNLEEDLPHYPRTDLLWV